MNEHVKAGGLVLKRRTVRKTTVWVIVWVIVTGLIETSPTLAHVRLPALISDDMVLQRDTKIALWGWADPGERIVIAFRGERLETKADKTGRWWTFAGPFSAGGPYDLTITGKNRIVLRNVLIGDVWLASGQSNMEFPLRRDEWTNGVINDDQEVAEATYPRIKLFKVHPQFAPKPILDVEADSWTPVSPETVGGFSAVAYLFGRELYRRYQVPIGLVESSVGGTSAEAWISAASLKTFPAFQDPISALQRLAGRAAVADDVLY